jgi:SNF2 family DNA or RNA helicase
LIHALYRRNKQHRFIIVVPSSLIENWSKEFDKWLGRASLPRRIVVKKGGNECSQQIRSFNIVKPNQSEALIISYDLFRVNSILLQDSKFIGLLVVDEGHRLKNSSGSMTLSTLESVKCEARLLITGTPIQNNLSEFYAVVNFVCPGILGSLHDFRRDFERPITTANRKGATLKDRQIGQEQVIALEVITKQFMLRRLAKDILSQSLPSRTELLIFCKPSAFQCELYGGISENPDDPLSTLSKLRKLCAHPDLVQMSAEPHSTIFNLSDSGKLKALELLLFEIRDTHPDDKVVLVSNFTSVLSMIEERLVLPNGWGYHRLDGNTPQGARQAMVDSFNIVSPARSFIFLLSSKAGGLGLNLIGANRLIMFDADYNPAIDSQAMARIYRSGQLKPSIIYRLFTSGTLEETILQRQMQKGNLSCVTIDSSYCDNLSKFNEDDLRECFTLKDTPCDTKAKMNSIWPEFCGTKTLMQQGCNDQTILSLTEKYPDLLQYIYLQRENCENAEAEEIFGNSMQPTMADKIYR